MDRATGRRSMLAKRNDERNDELVKWQADLLHR